MTDFNERQLEELLKETLPETPLVENLREVSPLGAAVDKIIAGLVMTTITLNFLNLNYILPTVGIMLIYLGMRTLRRGNGWFRLGWLAALGKLALSTLNLILQVTPYISMLDGWGLWVSQGVHMLFLFCLGMGIRQAGLDAGMEHPKMPTWPVMIWQAVLIALALAEVNGWAIMILMLYAWVRMVKHISHCADDLKQAGYVIPASSVWFSAKPLLAAYLVLLLAVMTGASLLVHYTPLEAQRVVLKEEIGVSEEAAAIRSELVSKGFPEEALSQILDEDLMDLGSVAAVDAIDGRYNTSNTERMGGCSVSVLTEDGRMKTFVWFEYVDGKHAGLVDSVKVQYDEYQVNTEVKGRILYEKDEETWTGDVDFDEKNSTYLWFGDITTRVWSETKYSFPFGADHPRGYFTWWTSEADGSPVPGSMNNTVFNCLRTPLVLPYVELPENADQLVLFGGFGSKWWQEKFQIYATPRFYEQ